jgi:hypothetical protein
MVPNMCTPNDSIKSNVVNVAVLSYHLLLLFGDEG